MISLYDRTRINPGLPKDILMLMDVAVCINIDGVTQHLLDTDPGNRPLDLPVMPPFRVMWFEYSSPAWNVGALAEHVPGPTDGGSIRMHLFEGTAKRIYKPFEQTWPLVGDGSGRRIRDPKTGHGIFGLSGEMRSLVERLAPDKAHEALHDIGAMLWPIEFALQLMHCKNVELVDAPMPPDKVRRKREKKLGHPLTQMKTLVLRPLATQKRREGDGEKHIPTHTIPLHICRGHFAIYSEDRPLFGKYAGTFWIPAHVRGTEQAGKVFKDYAIKAGGA